MAATAPSDLRLFVSRLPYKRNGDKKIVVGFVDVLFHSAQIIC